MLNCQKLTNGLVKDWGKKKKLKYGTKQSSLKFIIKTNLKIYLQMKISKKLEDKIKKEWLNYTHKKSMLYCIDFELSPLDFLEKYLIETGFTFEDFCRPYRKAELIAAKDVVIYFLKFRYELTCCTIRDLFKYNNHTTVSLSNQKVIKFLKNKDEMIEKYFLISKKIICENTKKAN